MFTRKTTDAVVMASDLLNTAQGMRSAQPSPDHLTTIEMLVHFIGEHRDVLGGDTGGRNAAVQAPKSRDLEQVRELRETLGRFWTAAPHDEKTVLDLLNGLLEDVGTVIVEQAEESSDDDAEPRYRRDPVPPSRSAAGVLRAHIAQGLQELVVAQETERLRHCHDTQCDVAIVDLSRNRSKLFCDFGNCANRSHVRAYRARKAEQRRAEEGRDGSGDGSAGADGAEGAQQAESATGAADPAVKRPKPSAAEKAAQLAEPTSESAVAAKAYRSQMRDELMEKRKKKDKKKKKKGKGKKADAKSTSGTSAKG